MLAAMSATFALAAFGCGDGDDPARDASGVDASADGRTDGSGLAPGDADGDAIDGAAGEAGPATTFTLATGPVTLVGNGPSTCSSQTGSTERWCAFARAATEDAPGELWVVNLDRARRGQAPCDGSSPHCLLLTSTLWTGDPVFSPSHPTVHGFFGDTLVFYTDSATGNGDKPFEGLIQAWRPGMKQGRVVSGARGYFCFGHDVAPVVICLSNQGAASGPLEYDLLGGQVQGAPIGALPLIERIRPFDGEVLVWGSAFPADGAYFAFTTKVDETMPPGATKPRPVLGMRIIPTRELGTTAPREILRNLAQWSLTHDGKKIIFMRDIVRDEFGQASGTLHTADFPAGNNVTPLATSVMSYEMYGESGKPTAALGLYQPAADGLANFRLMRDLSRPSELVNIASNVEEVLVSPDLRHSFLHDSDAQGETVSVVIRNDGSGRCNLNQAPGQVAYWVKFLPGQDRVIWAEDISGAPGGTGANTDGFLGTPGTCAGVTRFSRKLAYYDTTARSLLFGEMIDPGGRTMTLLTAPLSASGVELERKSLLSTSAGLSTALVGGESARFVVYTTFVSAEGPAGLFLHGPL